MEINTIYELAYIGVCNEPSSNAKFEIFSLQKGNTVFEGNWEELLASPYTNIPLASFDIAAREGFVMCFNLDDEDWDYEEVEE